jgi:CoA-transferase family III/Phage integrase family
VSDDHTRAHEVAAAMLPERSGPLLDVRVVDLTRALAGPYCTMILADMGADVIKVETPPHGDSVRLIGPHTEVDDEHHFGGYFASNNRNKRSVLLDLADPADLDRLRRLIDTSDVLVENEHGFAANDLMFRTRTGNRPTASNWSRTWQRALRQIGHPPLRVYDCRHAAATTWLAAGVPLGKVARRMGHSVDTLVSTYVGALTGDEDLANRRIEALLAGEQTWPRKAQEL